MKAATIPTATTAEPQRLPETFRSGGYDYRQLRRAGDVALFVKRRGSGPESFETVLVQTRPGELVFGQFVPSREVLPPSETWGAAGFSYCDRDLAERRFTELANRLKTARIHSKGSCQSRDLEAVGVRAA